MSGCFKCFLDFPSKPKFLQHKNRAHKDFIRPHGYVEKVKTVVCRVCDKKFVHQISLRKHLHSHHKDKKDSWCDLWNNSALILEQNQNITEKNETSQQQQSGPDPLEKMSEEPDSPISVGTTENVSMKQEANISETITSSTSVNFVLVKQEVDIIDSDDVGQIIMKTENNLMDNQLNIITGHGANICTDEESNLKSSEAGENFDIFQCKQCLKFFPTNLKFNPQIEEPHVNALCCNFGKQLGTRDHNNTLTLTCPEPQIFKCTMCKRKFATEDALRLHINSDHKDQSQHSCPVCSKIFLTRKKMRDQKSSVHSVKTYPCPKCGKNFKTRKHLKTHMVCHEGKNIQCIECGKVFYRKDELKERMLRVHTKEEEREVKTCKTCKRTYNDHISYRRHIRRAHRNDKNNMSGKRTEEEDKQE